MLFFPGCKWGLWSHSDHLQVNHTTMKPCNHALNPFILRAGQSEQHNVDEFSAGAAEFLAQVPLTAEAGFAGQSLGGIVIGGGAQAELFDFELAESEANGNSERFGHQSPSCEVLIDKKRNQGFWRLPFDLVEVDHTDEGSGIVFPDAEGKLFLQQPVRYLPAYVELPLVFVADLADEFGEVFDEPGVIVLEQYEKGGTIVLPEAANHCPVGEQSGIDVEQRSLHRPLCGLFGEKSTDI